MAKAPRARDSANTHVMPAHAVRTLGRTRIKLVRVSELLHDNPEEVRWCEQVSAELTAARIYNEVRRAAGMVAVYREQSAAARLPMFSKRSVAPDVVRIRARVRKLDGKWGAATVYALAREYRCAFCGRVFLLDEHGQEYVRCENGEAWYTHTHTGTNRHSRCCRDCLPGLRARLPVCSRDAAIDRVTEAVRVQDEDGES